jgi:hypothetical protein
MSNFESNEPSDNDWEDRGDLAWNEFDWEKYLREQDDVIHRYLAYYEQFNGKADRLDETAHLMDWDNDAWAPDPADSAESDRAEEEEEDDDDLAAGDIADGKDEPYTLHKNPIFISTKAIYLSLKRGWEPIAANSAKVPQPLAIDIYASIYRGEEQVMLAIQALDFGDYAMAISLFKRALVELNRTFALLNSSEALKISAVVLYRADAQPRLFDLREIWLRVMNECRAEIERPSDDDN